MKEKKKFRLFDAVLMAVVVILVVESAAPAASNKRNFFLDRKSTRLNSSHW